MRRRSGGIGILYTPQLTALPANTTVKVSLSASAYAEGENVYGSDIVVEAVEGAEFGSNNVVSKKGTASCRKRRHLVRRGQVRNLHRDARRLTPRRTPLLESGAGRRQQDALPARRHRRHLRGRNAS
ncbi:MAG: hypothetical protein ACLRMJ_03005 [Alistipes finegoldii]